MTKKYKRTAKRLIAVFLAAALLAGCTRGGDPTSGAYEKFPAGSDSSGSNSDADQFNQLTDAIFQEQVLNSGIDLHYLLADPASRKITDNPLTLGDYSVEAMAEDLNLTASWLKQLQAINFRNLSDDQKDTYKILSSVLETDLLSEDLELYSDPIATTIGIQAQLPILFAEYPFYNRKDVDNYFALLSDIDRYYGQLLEYEKQKSDAGLFMSDRAADHVLKSCEAYMLPPDHSFLAETFDTRINGLEGLTDEEKAAYKEKNLEVLKEHFIPAYRLLIDGITALMGTGKNDKGLCFYPKGKEYFEYLVKSGVGTSWSSVEKLTKAIEDQINEDLDAMRQITKEHPEALEMADDYAFSVTEANDILDALKAGITADFPELPENSCTVKYVPEALENSLSPAFYLVPPLDRPQDNTVYINNSPRFQNEDLFSTLAHEGYPGHLYQNVYFLNKNNCDLRASLSFPSYSEGWASYVEFYSYTMDNGLDPNLGKLLAYNSAVSLGIYALTDIRINYEGWNLEDTKAYLQDSLYIDDSEVAASVFDALVENPTNYMRYYVGYMEITDMRQVAEKVLKSRFDLKAFHTFLLDFGPAPFSVIQPEFQLWLGKQSRHLAFFRP